MKKIAWALLAGLAISTVQMGNMAHAQYTGGQVANTPTTVAEVLKNGTDDQRVTLRGQIVRRLYGDKYIFSDSTGEIRIDIDQDEWPAGQPINEKTMVEIIGKVDVDWGRVTEVDVKVLRIAK